MASYRRFKTGEECAQMGRYRFDGYMDGTSTPAPTAEEREVYVLQEHLFPPIPSQEKRCWWRPEEPPILQRIAATASGASGSRKSTGSTRRPG